MVATLPSNTDSAVSISGQGAETPHASSPKNQNIKQKQYCNRLNKDGLHHIQKKRAGFPVGIDCKVQSCNLERCVQVSDGGGIDSGEDRGDREHLANLTIYFRDRVNIFSLVRHCSDLLLKFYQVLSFLIFEFESVKVLVAQSCPALPPHGL